MARTKQTARGWSNLAPARAVTYPTMAQIDAGGPPGGVKDDRDAPVGAGAGASPGVLEEPASPRSNTAEAIAQATADLEESPNLSDVRRLGEASPRRSSPTSMGSFEADETAPQTKSPRRGAIAILQQGL